MNTYPFCGRSTSPRGDGVAVPVSGGGVVVGGVVRVGRGVGNVGSSPVGPVPTGLPSVVREHPATPTAISTAISAVTPSTTAPTGPTNLRTHLPYANVTQVT